MALTPQDRQAAHQRLMGVRTEMNKGKPDIMRVAQQIEEKIGQLDKANEPLEGLANDKAMMAAMYDKDLAIVLIQLKNGKPFILEGETVKDPLTSICEKIAKGICWESRLRADQAKEKYDLAVSKLETIKSQLNGWQSINKYLD